MPDIYYVGCSLDVPDGFYIEDGPGTIPTRIRIRSIADPSKSYNVPAWFPRLVRDNRRSITSALLHMSPEYLSWIQSQRASDASEADDDDWEAGVDMYDEPYFDEDDDL